MNVRINNVDVELKIRFKAFLLYEQITEKSYAPDSISDIVMFFFSVVHVCDKSNSITFDMFMDWLDDNQNAINDFVLLVKEYNTRNIDVDRATDDISNDKIEEVKKN